MNPSRVVKLVFDSHSEGWFNGEVPEPVQLTVANDAFAHAMGVNDPPDAGRFL